MADDGRPHLVLQLAAHVQEGAALRRAQPLVRVGGVVVRAERVQVERDHPARVRTVDQHANTASVAQANDVRDREHEPRRARHVVDQEQPRARRQRALDRIHDLGGGGERERDLGDDRHGAALLADVAHDVVARVVAVIGEGDLVAGLEARRAQDGVDGGRRVRDEDEVPRAAADDAGQRFASTIELGVEVALGCQPLDRSPLHLRAQARLLVEHGLRAAAERAVIEVRDRRVEQPGGAGLHRAAHGGRRPGAGVNGPTR